MIAIKTLKSQAPGAPSAEQSYRRITDEDAAPSFTSFLFVISS